MKHDIKVGDDVVFLYCQFAQRGKCLKVNSKTIKVLSPAGGGMLEFTKNVAKERVAHVDDVLTVVWDTRRGSEGRYRFDYVLYPQHAKRAGDWGQPHTYFIER